MRNGIALSAALVVFGSATVHAQTVPPQGSPAPSAATAPQPGNPPPAAKPPSSALSIGIDNGTSIRFGFLTQLQYEAAGQFQDENVAQNVFMRRMMLMIGGTVLNDFEFFLDTDFADMLKASGEQSLKNGPGITLKDVLMTYRAVGDALKIDGGLMLPPLSRISLQGAPFLYGLDFFASAYSHAGVFGTTGNSYGRDLGLQLRGVLFSGHFEYRAGVFQGRRKPPEEALLGSQNPFRYAGRIQLNVLDPDTVFFLRGTNLGEKRMLSFGAWGDIQHSGDDTYRSWGADALLDLAGVTAQVDYVYRNGGGLVELPKQYAIMGEAGYLFALLRLAPIGRVERRWGSGTTVDETLYGGGLSFFAYKHNANLKVYYVRGVRDDAVDYDQFNAQWQLFYY